MGTPDIDQYECRLIRAEGPISVHKAESCLFTRSVEISIDPIVPAVQRSQYGVSHFHMPVVRRSH